MIFEITLTDSESVCLPLTMQRFSLLLLCTQGGSRTLNARGAPDPKSGESANSSTWAFCRVGGNRTPEGTVPPGSRPGPLPDYGLTTRIVEPMGFEPTYSGFSVQRLNQLS